MAALTPTVLPDVEAPASRTARPRRVRGWRGVVLALAGLYFVVPLLASFVFTVNDPVRGFTLDAYLEIFGAEGFVPSLLLSLGLAAATIVVVLVLTLPAMLAVRLTAPRLRPVMEVLCTLPLVVPPITFVAGIGTVLRWGPDHLAATPFYQTVIAVQDPAFPVVLVIAYVVLALPFVYRALDSGLGAMDVRTLVEAARNCGASWPHVLLRVVVPNLASGLASASFLTLALVLGEYTVARLLGFQPFSVWIVTISGSDAAMSVAVSIFSLLLTWLLLLVLSTAGTNRRSRS
ncbi:ABC transporter permease subunit [Sphaerisporangium rubeum]|uniref:Putative spermidine/putrescine transport system permease protein n=1 Tax=Sphaerisporangium rubeum TaxID=321317 RepID=A0A7X0IHJ2_9ACTN|nr:ABC transporter permease subunit [Sphaerisporangium rubeum]MBB6475306.1 putative spermidine/putrescine transport system permease protein [Sphaerisporangium rubeum]